MQPISLKVLRQAAGILLVSSLIPAEALACACGCSTYDVGSSTLLPKDKDSSGSNENAKSSANEEDRGSGSVYFEWDHLNQNTNWNGTSKSSPSNNGDKNIRTDLYVTGLNYMFNRDWGMSVRIPTASRSFLTDTNFGNPGGEELARYHTSQLGDIEVTGIYTGFSNDLSKGLIFGLKLPTGSWKADGFDRDTQIGTGSTDLIAGGFWRGMITGDNAWQYFVQTKLLLPMWTHAVSNPSIGEGAGDYRPGWQTTAAGGIIYNNWYNIGWFDKIAPLLQIVYSHRQPDSGEAAANPVATGLDRIFISPGIDFTKVIDDTNNNTLKLYGDIEIPVYQRVKGEQLVSPYIAKVILAYTF